MVNFQCSLEFSLQWTFFIRNEYPLPWFISNTVKDFITRLNFYQRINFHQNCEVSSILWISIKLWNLINKLWIFIKIINFYQFVFIIYLLFWLNHTYHFWKPIGIFTTIINFHEDYNLWIYMFSKGKDEKTCWICS